MLWLSTSGKIDPYSMRCCLGLLPSLATVADGDLCESRGFALEVQAR